MDPTVPAERRRVAGAPSRPWVGISAPGAQDSPIVTSRMSLYVDVMTSADLTLRWVGAAVGTALLGGLAVIWGAAVFSLVNWPVGSGGHIVLYAAVVIAGPVLAL